VEKKETWGPGTSQRRKFKEKALLPLKKKRSNPRQKKTAKNRRTGGVVGGANTRRSQKAVWGWGNTYGKKR